MGVREVAQSVSYVEAWSRWLDGDPGLKDAVLWGWRILWWGRLGKALAFFSGFVLIVDMVGPDRIQRFIERSSSRVLIVSLGSLLLAFGWFSMVLWIAGLFPSIRVADLEWYWLIIALAGFVTVNSGFIYLYSRASRLPAIFAYWVAGRGKLVAVIRVVSLFLLAAGFHFDMLAS